MIDKEQNAVDFMEYLVEEIVNGNLVVGYFTSTETVLENGNYSERLVLNLKGTSNIETKEYSPDESSGSWD